MIEQVFVPDIGFRPREGVGLARPTTVTKSSSKALTVASFVSTELGSDLAFEIRDDTYERMCADGRVDYTRWHQDVEVRLRDEAGMLIAPDTGPGTSYSFGQHRFGAFGQKLRLAPVPGDARRVMLEVRGSLGDWDVPIDVLPLAQTDVRPATQITDATTTRSGVTIGVRAIAATEDGIALDIEAVTERPVLHLEVGAWMYDEDRLTLVDEGGDRVEETSLRDRLDMSRRGRGRVVALFPRVTSRAFTLIIPTVVVQESDVAVDVDIPIYAPTEVRFGRHPVVIRYAAIVDQLQPSPGQADGRGLEVQLRGAWHDGERVMSPGPVLVDGVNYGYRFSGYTHGQSESDFRTVSIPLGNVESVRRVTMRNPVVIARGPWEVRVSLP